jgi:hypothetical protein
MTKVTNRPLSTVTESSDSSRRSSFKSSSPSSSLTPYWNDTYFYAATHAYLAYLIIPNIVNIILNFDSHHGSENWVYSQVTGVLLLTLSCVVMICGILFGSSIYCRRKSAKVSISLGSSAVADASVSPSVAFLRSFYFVCLCLLFSFVLVVRSVADSCETDVFFIDWSCNVRSVAGSNIFPMETAFMLILIPLLATLIHKEISTVLTISLWMIVVTGLIISASLLNSFNSTVLVINYLIISIIMMGQTLHFQAYFGQLSDMLHGQLEESHRKIDEKKQNQMKDVIGNVAHDLKTVSLPFTIYFNILTVFCLFHIPLSSH